MRFHRRRVQVNDLAQQMSAEYQFLKFMCLVSPPIRQALVRDDFCAMDPGQIEMSPSMQAAFMRLYRSHPKGKIRQIIANTIAMMDYRLLHQRRLISKDDPEDMIQDEARTLNDKKSELHVRHDTITGFRKEFLNDNPANWRLKWKIRTKLLAFQRKVAIYNAAASRTALYSEDEALGYFLWRGPHCYAAVHRVLFELSRLMPWFVPKSMLDFGCGTGTAILAAKEVYDPGSLSHPIFRHHQRTRAGNDALKKHSLDELKFDLQRLQRTNNEKKKARFLAVAALIEKGELKLEDIPIDLRKELVETAANAHRNAINRERKELYSRLRSVVSGHDWRPEDIAAEVEAHSEDSTAEPKIPGEDGADGAKREQTWWKRYVDQESTKKEMRRSERLRPLQEITAIEPSPGMMEVAVSVLCNDVPNVVWKRWMTPDVEVQQHDLVIAAYTLSEIAKPETRRKTIESLWKATKGTLILIEYANPPGFNVIMEARDIILEQKDVGLWDWQPTIVGPCPHEKRCPLRFSKLGVKHRHHRVCKTEVDVKSTFLEMWGRQMKLRSTIEPISYVVFTRNENLPDRIERRKKKLEEEEAAKKAERDVKQRELYEATVKLDDVVFERLSEEALVRPGGDGSVPALSGSAVVVQRSEAGEVGKEGSSALATVVNPSVPVWNNTYHERREKIVTPAIFPVPTHKYNRAPLHSLTYKSERILHPAEVLTVRGEVEDIVDRYRKKAWNFYRVISKPHCSGRMSASFCTPEGEIIDARVYSRYYGAEGPYAPAPSIRRMWRSYGGWSLLRRSKAGALFPDDLPLWNVRVRDQVDFPNTLLDRNDLSHLEKIGMHLNTPMDLTQIPDTELSEEDLKLKRRQENDKEEADAMEQALSNIFSVPSGEKINSAQRVDSRSPIAAHEWSEAVKAAKLHARTLASRDAQREVAHQPFSKKIRQAVKTGFANRAQGAKRMSNSSLAKMQKAQPQKGEGQ
jgi:ribosomal protein RSM22 (predicted rRNA methylase)